MYGYAQCAFVWDAKQRKMTSTLKLYTIYFLIYLLFYFYLKIRKYQFDYTDYIDESEKSCIGEFWQKRKCFCGNCFNFGLNYSLRHLMMH